MRNGFSAVKRSILTGLACFAGILCFAVPAVQAGEFENVRGWVWSGTAGWISLNCVDPGTCDTVDYGVTFEDVPGNKNLATLSGWAWSETMGWICFGVSCIESDPTAITPEGIAPYAQFRRVYLDSKGNVKQNQIWGWARLHSLGNNGWISLNCANKDADDCDSADFYLGLNTSDGTFIDTAHPEGRWAWSGNNDGTGLGWIEFGAYAKTVWLPSQVGNVHRPLGIYEPVPGPGITLPGTHLHTIKVSFDNFMAQKGTLLECEMEMMPTDKRFISRITDTTIFNSPPLLIGVFEATTDVAATDPLGAQGLWYINYCRLSPPVRRSAPSCATDADCLAISDDMICDQVHNPDGVPKCRTVVDAVQSRWPVYVHGNSWTLADQQAAERCFDSVPGTYFNNVKKCDIDGDAAFALLMRRGLAVEGYCDDGLDADLNGKLDSADRTCSGLPYALNPALRPLACRKNSGDPMDCSSGSYGRGDRCCSNQPSFEGSPDNNMADGTWCRYGDANDGYFDCDCDSSSRFDANNTDDCYAPGAVQGEYCCTAESLLKKQP